MNDEGSWVGITIFIAIICWIAFSGSENKPKEETTYEQPSTSYYQEAPSYKQPAEDGYAWAEENDPTTFQECQDQFETGYDEDECNRYVKENYSGYKTFNDYPCTEDCSGHEAGYNWAEENGISDESECGGNSDSFIEGCVSYVEENY